jgi:hypothetical protein
MNMYLDTLALYYGAAVRVLVKKKTLTTDLCGVLASYGREVGGAASGAVSEMRRGPRGSVTEA